MFFNYIAVVPKAVWPPPPIAVRNILQIFKNTFFTGEALPKAHVESSFLDQGLNTCPPVDV